MDDELLRLLVARNGDAFGIAPSISEYADSFGEAAASASASEESK